MNYLKGTVSVAALAVVLFSGILAAEEAIHIVKAGETIYSISRSYRIKAEDLMRANGITDPSRLQTGGRLIIPSSTVPAASSAQAAPAVQAVQVTQAAPAASAPAAAPAQTLADHRVVRGDTLYSLARAYNISLQTLLEINRFPSGHVIRVGDIVKVPAREGVRTVQGGAGAPGSPAVDASLRWPVNPKEIAYMTGQMGVVVQGERFEPVKSLTQGKVISAGPWRKFGKVAIVEVSGGYYYVYGGCESLSVNVGDSIGPGTELGKLGINMVSEKPQLFFMVFQSNTPIDPAKAPRTGSGVKT